MAAGGDSRGSLERVLILRNSQTILDWHIVFILQNILSSLSLAVSRVRFSSVRVKSLLVTLSLLLIQLAVETRRGVESAQTRR
jgi:hypothetical protein